MMRHSIQMAIKTHTKKWARNSQTFNIPKKTNNQTEIEAILKADYQSGKKTYIWELSAYSQHCVNSIYTEYNKTNI